VLAALHASCLKKRPSCKRPELCFTSGQTKSEKHTKPPRHALPGGSNAAL
jgi:hypothetical protein